MYSMVWQVSSAIDVISMKMLFQNKDIWYYSSSKPKDKAVYDISALDNYMSKSS